MSVNPIMSTDLSVLSNVNYAPRGNLGVEAPKSGTGVNEIGGTKGLNALTDRANKLVADQTQKDSVKVQQKFNRTALSLFKASNTLDIKNPDSAFKLNFNVSAKETSATMPEVQAPAVNNTGGKAPDITPPTIQNELIIPSTNIAKNQNKVTKNANQNPTDFAGRANRAMKNIVLSNKAVKAKGPDITPPTIENQLNKNVNKFAQMQNTTLEKMASNNTDTSLRQDQTMRNAVFANNALKKQGPDITPPTIKNDLNIDVNQFAQMQNKTLEKMASNNTDLSLRQDQTMRNAVFANNALKKQGPDITPPTIKNDLNKDVNQFAQMQNKTLADAQKNPTSIAGIANRTMSNVVFSNNAVKKQGPDITPPTIENNLNSNVNKFAQSFNTTLKQAESNPVDFAGRANRPMKNVVMPAPNSSRQQVDASPDTGPSGLVKAVNDFATSYNRTLKSVQDNPVDMAGRENRPLKNVVMQNAGAFRSIGVEVNPNGMINVDQPTLTRAAEHNPNSISDVFNGTGGLASQVSNEAASFINQSISPSSNFSFSEMHSAGGSYGMNSTSYTGVFFSSPA